MGANALLRIHSGPKIVEALAAATSLTFGFA
jgi:hypothetical protein